MQLSSVPEVQEVRQIFSLERRAETRLLQSIIILTLAVEVWAELPQLLAEKAEVEQSRVRPAVRRGLPRLSLLMVVQSAETVAETVAELV